MDKNELIKTMEVILLMKDGISESAIMLEYNLGPYLKKAKKIRGYMERL